MMKGESQFEVSSYVRPFAGQDAKQDGVTHGPITAHLMVPEDTVFFGPQRSDGALRGEVKMIGAQTDYLASKRMKGMVELSSLQAMLTWLRCQAFPYHVYPISTRSAALTISW